ERYNMNKVWLNSKNMHGCKNTMLFQEIDQNNWNYILCCEFQ
ncbi:431_t:CDS:2, partial [Funneliformis geosporum]